MLKIIANGKEFFFNDIVRGENSLAGKAIIKGKSKVKTLAAVDVDAVDNLKTFVDSVITETRLEQGLDNLVREQLKPVEMTSMGDFLCWVYNDVIKEEQDTIVANGLDPKKLGGAIANVARPWFVKKVNEGVGL